MFTRTHLTGYLGFIALGLANAMIGPAIPHLIQEFHMSLSLVGATLFFQGTMYLVSVLFLGIASDYFGKKPFLLIGASFMILGLFGFTLAKSEIHLFMAIGFLGMGVGTLDGGVNGLFMDISGEEKGIGLGVLHMFFGIGALSGPLLFALTSTVFHTWRLAFLFTACLPILFFILLTPLHLSQVENPKKRSLSEVMGPFQKRFLLQFIFFLLVYVGAEQVLARWLPTYIINTRGVSHHVGSLSLSLFFVGLTSGRLFNGLISERIGYSQTLVMLSVGSTILFSLIFAAQSILLVIMLFALLGACFSGIYPTAMAQASHVFPQHSGTISGILTAAGGLGGMILPLAMGLVSDHAGLQVGLFLPSIATATMLCLALLSSRLIKRQKTAKL